MEVLSEREILLHQHPWLNTIMSSGLTWWHQSSQIELFKRELPVELLRSRDYGFLPRVGEGLTPILRERTGRLFFAVNLELSELLQNSQGTAYMLDYFPNSLCVQLQELHDRKISVHYLVESWDFQVESKEIVRRPYVVLYPLLSETITETERLFLTVHFISLVELVIKKRSTKY